LFDETARLLKETEQRAAELQIINSVQEGLASKLEMQAIYDLVGDHIRDLFDAQGVKIGHYDRPTNMLKTHYELFRGQRIAGTQFEFGKGLSSHIIRQNETLLINENAAARFREMGAVMVEGEEQDTTKSWLGVPLATGGTVSGVLILENYEREHAYSDSDVRVLQTLANSLSVALENARLFDETQRLLKETEQRNAELAIINSVQEGLASKLEIQAIYDLVGDMLAETFKADTSFIAFHDTERNLMVWPYYSDRGVRASGSRPYGQGLFEVVVESGKPLLVNTIAEGDALGVFSVPSPGSEQDLNESVLIVPIFRVLVKPLSSAP
jgi:GAF domain-containing protein